MSENVTEGRAYHESVEPKITDIIDEQRSMNIFDMDHLDITRNSEHNAAESCCLRHGKEWLSFFQWDGNKNAKALSLSHVGSGTCIITSVFLSTALVEFAKVEAGCIAADPDKDEKIECNNRVYGMVKPSSLVSIYLVILGFIASFFMPIIGALTDSTNYRRGIGRVTAICIGFSVLLQTCFLSQSTWLVVALLRILLAIFETINLCVSMAYIPELTPHEDVLSRYNASMSICFNISIVIFLLFITSVSTIFKTSTIRTAQIAMIYCVVCIIIFYGIPWGFLFQPQTARVKIQTQDNTPVENDTNMSKRNLLIHSIRRLWRTLQKVLNERHDLKWILLSRSITQPGIIAMTTSMITYAENNLKLSSSDIGFGLLIMLTFALPGNKISVSMTRRLNPCLSLQLCFVLWVITNLSVVSLVYDTDKKEQKVFLFIIMAIWGTAVGWKEPTEKTIFSQLIPPGHEAEMMGLYIFASHFLTWLPPLIFTALNESNAIHIRVNIGIHAIYFVIGIILLVFVGDYAQAVSDNEKRRQELEDEQDATISPATDEPSNENLMIDSI